jgi:WD40 repeat protein
LTVWRLNDLKKLFSAEVDPEFVRTLAFHPRRALVAASGDAGIVTICRVPSGERVNAGNRHLRPISAIAFNVEGNLLATGDLGGKIQVWDLTSGARLLDCDLGSGSVLGLAFGEDTYPGRVFAVSAAAVDALILGPSENRIARVSTFNENPIVEFDSGGGGSSAVLLFRNGTLRTYSSSFKESGTPRSMSREASRLRTVMANGDLAACSWVEGAMGQAVFGSWAPLWKRRRLLESTDGITALAVSAIPALVVVGDMEGRVSVLRKPAASESD